MGGTLLLKHLVMGQEITQEITGEGGESDKGGGSVGECSMEGQIGTAGGNG